MTLDKHEQGEEMVKKDQKHIQEPKKIEEQLKKDIEEKSKIMADYENTLKRLQADFENYVKRIEKEKQDFAKYATAKIMTKLLNIVDDLDRALQVLEKSQDEEIKTGIRMVHKQFHRILEEEGVSEMDCFGKKIDPYTHEIIEMKEHESPEGTIIEVAQKGYKIHDKILRTAKVRVSKGKTQEKK